MEEGAPSRPPLSVLTWNTLAPCYFRCGHGVEADEPSSYLARHARICAALSKADADIVCLQEYWFEPSLLKLYEETLGEQYQIISLRRSGFNCDGRSEDGVAIMLRRGSMNLDARQNILFQEHGIPQDRVALMVRVRDGRCCGSRSRSRLAVLCTHLTYPHSGYDEQSRLRQIDVCLKAVTSAQMDDDLSKVPVLVCGDFNGPEDDVVGQAIARSSFAGAWRQVHGRPCAVTHVDHRGRQYACDHVWFRGEELKPSAAELLPQGMPDSAQLRRPEVQPAAMARSPASDHSTGALWCDLSDHRPLLVTFV